MTKQVCLTFCLGDYHEEGRHCGEKQGGYRFVRLRSLVASKLVISRLGLPSRWGLSMSIPRYTRQLGLKAAWVNAWAYIIRCTKVNRTKLMRYPRQIFIVKKRHWTGEWIVLLGNQFFRLVDIRIRFLSRNEWYQRERQIYRILYQKECFYDNVGQLWIPHFKGVVLHDILSSSRYNWQNKKDAYAKAVHSLKTLHDTSWRKFRLQEAMSHGDASARNVLLSRNGSHALWIDFETRHSKKLDHLSRRMDDMRVLLFSAAKNISDDRHLEDLFLLSISTYPRNELWTMIKERGRTESSFNFAFFLARSGLSVSEYNKVQGAFQKIQT